MFGGKVKLRVLIAAIIFVGSYLPLSLILLAQNFDYSCLSKSLCFNLWAADRSCVLPLKNPGFAIGIFIACVSCFVLTLATLRVVSPKHEIIIKNFKYVPAELMSYVLPYVVSFMSIDYQETGKFVGFLIFLGWMFWITYKSGQIILNPVLTAFGWRLYDITYSFPGNDREHSGPLLAKTKIMSGGRYRHAAIQDVLVIKASAQAE